MARRIQNYLGSDFRFSSTSRLKWRWHMGESWTFPAVRQSPEYILGYLAKFLYEQRKPFSRTTLYNTRCRSPP
jgi:hypothetical protein